MKRLSILSVLLMAATIVFGQSYNMQNGSVITCSGSFYDSGGPSGSYSNSENLTFTIHSASPGSMVQVYFSALGFKNGDVLVVHNGDDVTAPILFTIDHQTKPPVVALANNSTGSLTFNFISNWNNTDFGWSAAISCVSGAYDNGTCATALEINEVSNLVFNTTNASASGKTPGCTSQPPIDLWYAYTATNTGNGYFDLCGSGFNTVLAIWDDCGDATSVACNNNNGPICTGQQSSIIWPVTEGTTYYVQVGGHNGSTTGIGNLTIQVEPVRWTGLTSNDWGTASNWAGNNVPDETKDAIIPSSPIGGNFPETNSLNGAVCNNLTILPGAHVHVPSDNSLTVHTTLTNQAGTSGILLKADANGMASLLHSTPNVAATTEQYISSEVWHMVSPPISYSEIGVYFDIYLYSFNEPTNTWTNLVEPITIPMNATQGYRVWASDNYTGSTTVTYSGNLNNGDYDLTSLSFTPGSDAEGWNLIGNPYVSSLQWNSNWIRTDIGEWACVQTGTSQECYNFASGDSWPVNGVSMPDGIIPPTQGFWVRALSSGASLTIPQSERLHSDQAFYKGASITIDQNLRLQVEGSTGKDEIMVQFHPEATIGFNGRFDLDKFMKVDDLPQIYVYAENEEYAVKALPELIDGLTIPVGFEADRPGLFTLRTLEFEGMDESMNIYLEDITDHSWTHMEPGAEFTFAADPGDDAHRFNLRFESAVPGKNEISASDLRIYSHGNVVYIQRPADFTGSVSILTMMGQLVSSTNGNGSGQLGIPVDGRTGFYIVRVENEGNLITEKVFIK